VSAWWWTGTTALAFWIGAIPFGYLIGRARGIDIRRHGSGNIGTTNVGRVLGKRTAALCLALDVGKGLGPTLGAGAAAGLVGGAPGDWSGVLAWQGVGLAAVLGHVFSPWLGFKGGKGVATGLGAVLGVYPVLTLAAAGAAGAFVGAVLLWRYMSVASMVAAGCLPACALAGALVLRGAASAAGAPPTWAFLALPLALAALVPWTHRGNLARLRAGTEPRLWGGAGADAPPPDRAA